MENPWHSPSVYLVQQNHNLLPVPFASALCLVQATTIAFKWYRVWRGRGWRSCRPWWWHCWGRLWCHTSLCMMCTVPTAHFLTCWHWIVQAVILMSSEVLFSRCLVWSLSITGMFGHKSPRPLQPFSEPTNAQCSPMEIQRMLSERLSHCCRALRADSFSLSYLDCLNTYLSNFSEHFHTLGFFSGGWEYGWSCPDSRRWSSLRAENLARSCAESLVLGVLDVQIGGTVLYSRGCSRATVTKNRRRGNWVFRHLKHEYPFSELQLWYLSVGVVEANIPSW